MQEDNLEKSPAADSCSQRDTEDTGPDLSASISANLSAIRSKVANTEPQTKSDKEAESPDKEANVQPTPNPPMVPSFPYPCPPADYAAVYGPWPGNTFNPGCNPVLDFHAQYYQACAGWGHPTVPPPGMLAMPPPGTLGSSQAYPATSLHAVPAVGTTLSSSVANPGVSSDISPATSATVMASANPVVSTNTNTSSAHAESVDSGLPGPQTEAKEVEKLEEEPPPEPDAEPASSSVNPMKAGPQPAHFASAPSKTMLRKVKYERVNMHDLPASLPAPPTAGMAGPQYLSQEEVYGYQPKKPLSEAEALKRWPNQFSKQSTESELEPPGLKPVSLPFASSLIQNKELSSTTNDFVTFDPNKPPPCT